MAPEMTYASSWALQIEASARWDDTKCAAAALDATRADEAASAGWLPVAALDDLQGACDAALSRRDPPDDLAPAYDTFLAAMTSLLELVGG